jgi:secondary thiamine-phosphate synthase enzyme
MRLATGPLRQATGELKVVTQGRGLYEVTETVNGWLAQNDSGTGLVTLHVKHTSASLVIQENADPDVRRDLEAFFSRLIPDGDPLYVHTMEGDDDMPAHVRSALTAVNLSIPVRTGRMDLGTWQGVYLWEHRRAAHRRVVTAHYIGD